MRKRTASLLGVFLLLAGILLGCTKSSESSPKEKSRLKIGFVLATMNEERYQKDKRYFLEYAKSQGVDVEFASCEDNVSVQASKVETLLSKGVDVLVIQPVDGKTASQFVKSAKQDGVPVLAYDRLILNAEIEGYITQDSFEVGRLQALAAVKTTEGKGNYVILKGESGHSVAEQITKGYLSVLKEHPKIKVVVEQHHPGWSTALALATVENALTRQKNKIDAVLANNDGMALGAAQALEEQKLAGKVFVAGADADLTAIKNIVAGKQSMTVLKGIKPLAIAAVDAAIALKSKKALNSKSNLYNGKKYVPVIPTPVYAVNKDNIQTQIIDYGFHAANAIYGNK